MQDVFANPIRGEAPCRIGKIDFRIAVTFSGLVRISEALGARSIDDIYSRLLAFEPKAVAVGIRCLIVADDDDKAVGLAARILHDGNISAADEDAWQAAVERAISAHVELGRRHRDERATTDIVDEALGGNVDSPS